MDNEEIGKRVDGDSRKPVVCDTGDGSFWGTREEDGGEAGKKCLKKKMI